MRCLLFFCYAVVVACLGPVKAFPSDITPPVTYANPPGQQYSSSLTVTLQCSDNWESGCNSTFYCLGDGCDPVTPYLGAPVRVLENTTLRFYSIDKASNVEPVKTEKYTVAFPDQVAPVVEGLIIPSLYRSLTIPVTVYATDNVNVAGYCLTETSDPASCTWTESAPASYTFTAGGSHTLYAFAKDAAGNVSAPRSATLSEEANFIRVQPAADMVYDQGRDILYIASGGAVQRYQVSTRTLLSPYQTGGTLSGVDLSPDGSTLAVADQSRTSVYLINLTSGAIIEKSFTPASFENGEHSVAFANDGSLLVASAATLGTFQGTSSLRRLDPASGEVTVIDNGLMLANLMANADRSCLVVDDGEYNGSIGWYDVATRKIVQKIGANYASSEIAIGRDCSQLANSGEVLSTATLSKKVSLSETNSSPGVVYHPRADLLFLGIVGSSTVTAYDTNTFRSVLNLDTRNSLSYPGRLRIAPDGSYLFARVVDGIQVIPLSPMLPQNQVVVTSQGTPVSITLKTAIPFNDLSFQVDSPPRHGTLTGTVPDLTYTPGATFEGTDGFTFTVTNSEGGTGSGNVAITVSPDATPPVITTFSVPATSATPLVEVAAQATDNIGVTGYCLNESNTTNNCTWITAPPTSIDFTSTYNVYSPHVLYLFARDAAGNVSLPATANVSINSGGAAPPPPEFTLPAMSGGVNVIPTLISNASTGIQYCVTEVNDLKQCTPHSWYSFPTSYTFDGYGLHTLYLFAMSSTGAVSAPASAVTLVVGARGDEVAISDSWGATGEIFDPASKTLFVAQSGKVLRYDLQGQQFLTPLLVGKTLGGIDLSPDGNTLVVGNAGGLGVFLIDLRSGSTTQVDFIPVAGEPKTSGVAFASDGAVFAWGKPGNSYGTPVSVRRFDPVTGEITVIASLAPGWYSSIFPSPGGKCLGINDGNGNAQLYETSSHLLTTIRQGWNGRLMPNRDCSQFAVDNNFYDRTLTRNLGSVPSSYLGVSLAYDGTKDIVYSLNWNTVTAYDTTSFGVLGTYMVQGASMLPGMLSTNAPLAVSRDGSFVFALFYGGVGYAKVSGAAAEDQSLTAHSPSVPVTLIASTSRGTGLTYRIVSPPSHGTLNGSAPSLIYTPFAGYVGQDAFTFSVNDGTEESAPGRITITMQSPQPNPLHANLSLTRGPSLSAVSVDIYVYGNSTADPIVGPVSWCLTENPSASSCAWSATKPIQYTFSGDFPQGVDITRTLYAYVMDGTGKISTPGAGAVVITRPDTTAPTIQGFRMPSAFPSLQVPFNLVGGDNVRSSFYCLSESDDATGCWWQYLNNAGLTVTLHSYGSHTFYAFVRDGSGNISSSSSATVFAVNPPTFAAVPKPAFTVGTAASYSIAATGFPTPTLTLSGTLPPGISFTANGDGTASFSGTAEPGSAGVYPVTVLADSGMGFTASKDLNLAVVKVKQTITFAPLASKTVHDPPFTVAVEVSSGLPITLTSSNPAVALVDGGTASVRNIGYTKITAVQSGNGTYDPVSATHVLNVAEKRVESVLTLSALRDGDTTDRIVMNVAGKVTEPDTLLSLTVNGSDVAVDADGYFSTAVGLVAGANAVTTTASLRDGVSVTDVRFVNLLGGDTYSSFYLDAPGDNAVLNTALFNANGLGATGSVVVQINAGAPFLVSTNQGGSYSFMTPLDPGMNTILVTGTDPAGNLITNKRTFRFEGSNPPVAVESPHQDALLYDMYRTGAPVGLDVYGTTVPGATVTVEAAGKTMRPKVQNGQFLQWVDLPRPGPYSVKVTADAAGAKSSTIRNVIYLSGVPDGILVAAKGKSAPDLTDVLRALQIAVGNIAPTLDDLAHGDVAPLNGAMPAPDGQIGLEDALVILERVVGQLHW